MTEQEKLVLESSFILKTETNTLAQNSKNVAARSRGNTDKLKQANKKINTIKITATNISTAAVNFEGISERIRGTISNVIKETFDEKLNNADYTIFFDAIWNHCRDYFSQDFITKARTQLIKDLSFEFKQLVSESGFWSQISSVFKNFFSAGKKHYYVNPKISKPTDTELKNKIGVHTQKACITIYQKYNMQLIAPTPIPQPIEPDESSDNSSDYEPVTDQRAPEDFPKPQTKLIEAAPLDPMQREIKIPENYLYDRFPDLLNKTKTTLRK